MGNTIDYMFMESYKPRRNMRSVRASVNNARSLENRKDKEFIKLLETM